METKEDAGGDRLYDRSEEKGGAGNAMLPSRPITALVICVTDMSEVFFLGGECQAAAKYKLALRVQQSSTSNFVLV